MVAVVDELEELGYAERRTHPADRRKHAIHLTADGRRMLERAQTVAMETTKEILAPLTADEIDELRLLLRKLAGVED
jgi:DNA-binding MarR family transcriptional regulator